MAAANGIPASLAAWKRAVKSLESIAEKDLYLHLGGGEAFLLPDILELARYAIRRGFTVNIPSNGYLIDQELARRIGRSGLHLINLSLDTLDEKKHDFLRGVEGVYQRVMDAIEYLDRYAPRTKKGICTVISEYNLEDIIPLTSWALKNKSLDWIDFMVIVQPNNTSFTQAWYRSEEFGFLWPKDAQKAASVLEEIIRLKRQNPLKISNQVCQLEAFKSYFRHPDCFVKKNPCNMDQAVHVSAVGDIFICYQHDRLGNIEHDDLAWLWYSSEADRVRAAIRDCRENCHFLLNCYFEGDYPFRVDSQLSTVKP